MKLSFVIPAYNEENYLGECLKAIAAETGNAKYDTEVIVVNNASTDNTKAIAQRFPGVTVVDEMQKGLVKARHAGFINATGEIIANIDSDTRISKGWLEKVMSQFEEHPRLVALSGPFVYYDMSAEFNFIVRLYYYIAYLMYLVNRFVLRRGSLLQGGNFVVKKTALEQVGGFDTSIDFFGEDADVARRMVKAGQVKFMLSLKAYSSGRRLAGEGALKTGWKYLVNYVWIMLLGRPYHTASSDFRK